MNDTVNSSNRSDLPMNDTVQVVQAEAPVHRQDDFKGDDARLISCIDALLDFDDDKALVPHGLGGKYSHAYRLLVAARQRLATRHEATAGLVERDFEPEDVAAIERAEKMRIVSWLRDQSAKGADRGLASNPGSTRRAAFGGGSLALKRAADEIENDAHCALSNKDQSHG